MQTGPLCNLQGIDQPWVIPIATEQLFVCKLSWKKKKMLKASKRATVNSKGITRCAKSGKHKGTSKQCLFLTIQKFMFLLCINSRLRASAYQSQQGKMWNIVFDRWLFFGNDPKLHKVGPTRYKLAWLFWLKAVLLSFHGLIMKSRNLRVVWVGKVKII